MIMLRIIRWCLCAFIAWSFVNPALAEEKVIKIAATEWVPYMSETFPDKGVIPEITRVALEKAGYKVVFEFYPWKRLLMMTENGEVDAALGVSYTEERTKSFQYPQQPTFEDRKVIIYNNTENVLKEFTGDLKALCPESVGVMSGSYLEERLKKIECLKVDPLPSFEKNLEKLIAGRFKYFLESETSVKVLLSNNKHTDAQRKMISFYETPVDIDKNYTVFSRKALEKNPELLSVIKAFDENLAQMKTDGTYNKILRDHNM